MYNDILLGAVAGDTIGSAYEFAPTKDYDFELLPQEAEFTDDTVMTVAVAHWLMAGGSVADAMVHYGSIYPYPKGSYGLSFKQWLRDGGQKPYGSWGNGSAMRVTPVGWAFATMEETLKAARLTAEVSHNHPEGIKGAEAVAACVFMARTGSGKSEIREYVERQFGYDLGFTCDDIRPGYCFEESCQRSVPQSIVAFLDSTDFESAVRLAVSLGGDADTMGAITGGIAEAFYDGVPEHIAREVLLRLPNDLTEELRRFHCKYIF